MKNYTKQLLLLVTVFTFGFNNFLHAQSVYRVIHAKDAYMKLSGTSTLHNWDMKAHTFSGEALFIFKHGSETALESLKSLSFILAVRHLSSGEKGLDNNAYKALKSKKFKNIVYKLASATISPEHGNKFLLKTRGHLNVAGVTKEITMDVHCVINNDGTVTFSGSHKLKMSDYSVKGPTFMVVMKTGDAVTLDFTVVYKK